ncbi:hypothetical protein COK07_13155 [Bacillus thuringiensis]|nr:hypothetical protein COI53_06805 [Bacillus thuringiensis]PFP78136.1 hypothetical protein COK07_13155 [Bacillus thuringiensis]
MKEADYGEINYMFLVVILIIIINYLLLPIFNMNTFEFFSRLILYTAMIFLVLAYTPCKNKRIKIKSV